MRRFAVILLLGVGAVACAPPVPPSAQAPVISTFEALGATHVDPALVPLRWTVSDPQDDAISCRLDGDGDGVWDQTFDPCPPTASRNVPTVASGTHTARFEVSDGTNTTVATTTYTVAPSTSTEGFDIVIRPVGSLDPDVLAAFEWAASRWEDSIARGLSDMEVTLGAGSCGVNSAGTNEVVDDLVVEVSMSSETYPAAALAWMCVQGPDSLPRYGYVEVNPELLPGLRTLDVVDEVALHELGHVLGFGTVGQFYGLVAGGNTVDPRFTGPRALAEYSALGRSGGIPVMTIDGVMQPHWESAFFEEIMASVLDGRPLSRLTIAAMADLGYAVDLDAADPYSPSLPAGTCITFSATVIRCW